MSVSLRPALALVATLACLAGSARAQLRILDVHSILERPNYWNESVGLFSGQRVSIALLQAKAPTIINHEKVLEGLALFDWDDAIGYTADGVSLLVLGFRAPERGCVTFELFDDPGDTTPALESSVGRLRDSFQKYSVHNDLMVSTRTISYWNANENRIVDEEWAFAELMAPEDFARGPGDYGLRVRAVKLLVSFQPLIDCGTGQFAVQVSRNLILHRPPVVMVHGIFSSNDMWDDQGWAPFFNYPPSAPAYPEADIKRVDYSGGYPGGPTEFPGEWVQENARSFARNREFVPEAIEAAIKTRRQGRIATTKVDVIGHSMGGILARLYAEDMHRYKQGIPSGYRFFRPDNFRSGDIHKLVTMDSPLEGSKWSDLIDRLAADSPKAKALIKKLGAWLKMPPFQGAAMDMCSDSYDTVHMREALVPAHALVATGGKAASQAIGSAVEAFLKKWLWFVEPSKEFYSWLNVTLVALINGPELFNGLEHDLVVSEPSQRGGLTGNAVTNYALPMFEMTHTSMGNHPGLCGTSCWVGVGSSPTMATRFLGLLNETLLSNFADRFPRSEFYPEHDAPALPPPAGGGGGHEPAPPMEFIGLELLAPLEGASVTAGSTIQVVVGTLQNYAPQYIGLVVGGELYEPIFDAASGTYDAQVTIPLDALGELDIQVVAVDAAERISSTHGTVHATLPPGATLLALSVAPASVDLWNAEPAAQLRVTGVYADAERDLTNQPGVVYDSSTPSVADVSSTGLVTGSALGQATVTVSYAGFSRNVSVQVHEIKGDHDGDGDVDTLDFGAFMQCFTGPIDDPQYDNESNACLTTFDFDGDVDVDAADYDLFLTAFTGVLGVDCNGNLADDMDDIFGGFSTDCDHDGLPDDCAAFDCNANGLPDSCDVTPQDEGFEDPATYDSASTIAPRTVALGDFDGDGDRDAAVCHPGSGISVLMNEGGGVFGSATANGSLPSGTVTTIAAADLDGGGDTELLVCVDSPGASADTLVVKSNCPLGVFQDTFSKTLPPSGMPAGSGPRALAVGDFNSDGKVDVAIAMGTAFNVTPHGGKVFVLFNTSTLTTISFSASVGQLNAQAGARALIAADVQHDGKLDLLVANYSTVTEPATHSVMVLRGNGNGTFQTPGSRAIYTTFVAPLALAAGDMNGDGWPEVGVVNEFTGIVDLLVNRGVDMAGQFTVADKVARSIAPRDLVAGDLDGDGRSELVVTDQSLGEVQVLSVQCKGCRLAGTVGATVLSYSTPSAPVGVALGDLDGDLDLDAVTSNLAAPGQLPTMNVLRNHVLLPFSRDADADGVPDECFPDWDHNGRFDSCDIAQGDLPDCNANLLPDGSEPLTPAVDCNANLVLDACEVSAGTAQDCDDNGVIDACDIAAGAPDCNANGVPDSCDISSMYSETSPVLHDFYFGSEQAWSFPAPPPAMNDPAIKVKLRFVANADFAAVSHQVQVRLNNILLAPNAFAGNYNGCNSPFGPDTSTIELTPTYYNSIKGTGNVTIRMTPTGSAQTGMQQCLDTASWIQVTLEYSDAFSLDQNHNGVPDGCPGG